jgi:hypothetical protein
MILCEEVWHHTSSCTFSETLNSPAAEMGSLEWDEEQETGL